MRRRRIKRKFFWTGTAGTTLIGSAGTDYCNFINLVPADEIQVRSPGGAVCMRVLLDFYMKINVSSGVAGPFGGPYPVDLFLMARGAENDDAGTEIWVSGTNVLKPFVRDDLASTDLGASRKYMWTKRVNFEWNIPASTALTFWSGQPMVTSGVGTTAQTFGTPNHLASPGGMPAVDLRVKRRLQVGENVILGLHTPIAQGDASVGNLQLIYNCRLLFRI